ncbi:TIGR03767 family metallophosphoesterase [Nakamurella antarctica]|uniref:TIGR03767 family metallophosphoesterase n=1 Tax=Nakamurella antarctica TaxID=1902245 RepID=A0A3G8ZQN3_9ACTN|nr:TIGR03767 family metallophosphoesterase [Nakamurella antarctica]AZI59115.1 TIGR03767 family metallophosphoesterase [Nakamurella antarctica]
MTTTDRATVIGGARSPLGYWSLTLGPGESHISRAELASIPANLGNPLLSIGHLSDLHLCDSQSPARADFLDRWADDDSPLKSTLGIIGSYRAQDCVTVQVGEAMVRALNAVRRGPVGGAPLDWAITTGDVTDNAHANELGWYINLLDGGPIVPDSGDRSRYEGSADHDYWNESYWHPDPSSQHGPDRPRRLHGFPDAPGLLDALREPFTAGGLQMPWLAVHGNHDQLIQGKVNATGSLGEGSTAGQRAIDVPPDWSLDQIARFCAGVDSCDPATLALWSTLPVREITADPLRRIISRDDFIGAHFHDRARPIGHGFSRDAPHTAYYRYDHQQITVLVLDTVNEHGGWQGSIEPGQLAWLESELVSADAEKRYIVLASHHTSEDLVNDTVSPGAPRRVLGAEFAAALEGHPCLILWLNGHTHISRVTAHPGRHPWWEVTTPSLIDFPQQGRIVEVLRADNAVLTIATTMLDHSGELPWSGATDSVLAIAGLSRELAANDSQWRVPDLSLHVGGGTAADRNVLLHLVDPYG